MQTAGNTISLCMIVRNEAACLPRCLAQAGPLVDGMFITDTGSTDATIAIARAAGATVSSCAWVNDFSDARNASLAPATGDWILVLDADEVLTIPSPAAWRAWVASLPADVAGVYFDRVNHAEPGGTLAAWPDEVLRFFRNRRGFAFARSIHESVDDSIIAAGGRIVRAPWPIEHYGFLPGENYLAKSRRYEAALNKLASATPADYMLQVLLAVEYDKQERYDDEEQALTRALALSRPPHTAGVDSRLGSFYAVRRQDPARARGHFRAAAAAAEQLPTPVLRGEVYLNLSKCELVLGDHSAAWQWLERALPLLPAEPDLYRHGLQLCAASGDPRREIYFSVKLLALDENADLRYALALRYIRAGNGAMARRTAAAMLAAYPGDPRAAELLARLS
ncbi:MAG TPA: glycosyltransferase family 2 protein [bacterium]|nr:glycosyltransferase family 2 protein [bacterium]